jgi:LacI family transcriptional regulator
MTPTRLRLTISDIAKLAGVSKSSVSLVLNNKPGVSEKIRREILEIIEKYRYNPSQIAQSLAARETRSIGLIIKEIDNPYFSRLMRGVYDSCSELGYSVLLGSSELSEGKEAEIIKTLVSKRVDGLIISPLQSEGSDFSYLIDLLKDNYPLVILGAVTNYPTNVVDIDNTKAAYDAVSLLIRNGHTKIAHFGGPVHSGHGQKRLEGYKQALSDHGIPINKNYIAVVEPYIPDGYQAGKNLFSGNSDAPTAVFCYNDLVAIGLINALTDLGIEVPDDVSVMGFDNIDFSEYVRIPLTTVQMPAYEIGKAAASLLIKQINKPSPPLIERVILEHKIIERDSIARRSGQELRAERLAERTAPDDGRGSAGNIRQAEAKGRKK